MAEGPLTCGNCGGGVKVLVYTNVKTLGWCRGCCYEVRGKPDAHVRTNKKLWLGSEVYGKKLFSDELRSDTESAMLGGSGAGLKG